MRDGICKYVEHIWIRLKVCKKVIAVGKVYRVNTNINFFINKFDTTLSNLYSITAKLYCVGDFNINAFNVLSPARIAFIN